jgi:asparagine synthase (glutamine-hydrolysing)
MSGVAAILELDGSPADPAELSGVLRELERIGPDGTRARAVGATALVCARFDTLPQDGPQPITLEGVTVVADARLDNRDDLERQLKQPKGSSDTSLIAAAIANWGDRAAEELEGDFAVIAWHGRYRKLIAFRDRYGVKPLFYAEVGGKLLIASLISALTRHPGVTTNLDRDYFLEYLAARMPPTPLTPYTSIKRLMPATVLIAEKNVPPRFERYYRLNIELHDMKLEEAAERTRILLEESVHQRLRAIGPVTSDVSGGMDSTSIYATAWKLGAQVHARSIVSDRWPVIDERSYSRELVGNRPWSWIFVEENPPFEHLDTIPLLFDEPVQDVLLGNLRPAVNEAVPEGGRVVFSGHGGDALMTGGFDVIREAIYGGRWLTAYKEARRWADERDRSLLYMLKWSFRRAHIVPSRLAWSSGQCESQAREVVRRVKQRLRDEDNGIDSIDSFLLSTQAGIRQETIDTLEVRYPFLSRTLVEFALSTPSSLKFRAPMGKRVVRHAMADRLPVRILERTSKTGFDVLYVRGAHTQWPQIERLLKEPTLAEMNLLDRRGMVRLATELREGKTQRLVEAMRTLAVEAWIWARSHGENPSTTSMSATGRPRDLGPTEVGRR